MRVIVKRDDDGQVVGPRIIMSCGPKRRGPTLERARRAIPDNRHVRPLCLCARTAPSPRPVREQCGPSRAAERARRRVRAAKFILTSGRHRAGANVIKLSCSRRAHSRASDYPVSGSRTLSPARFPRENNAAPLYPARLPRENVSRPCLEKPDDVSARFLPSKGFFSSALPCAV